MEVVGAQRHGSSRARSYSPTMDSRGHHTSSFLTHTTLDREHTVISTTSFFRLLPSNFRRDVASLQETKKYHMILYQSPVSFHPKEMERNGCVVWYNTGNSHFEFRARFPFSIFDDREKKINCIGTKRTAWPSSQYNCSIFSCHQNDRKWDVTLLYWHERHCVTVVSIQLFCFSCPQNDRNGTPQEMERDGFNCWSYFQATPINTWMQMYR